MNLLLEKVESAGSQRTAVILVSRGVTLLVYGFGQLVFVMPQTFVPFTETRNDETKWMNLLLEKVESPGSQRTAVILVSRGVTLLVCGFDQLVFVMPQSFVRVESPGSPRTAVILVSRGVTLLVCGFGQLVFVMPQTFVPFTETRNDKTKWMNLLLERGVAWISAYSGHSGFAWSHAVGVWFWPVGFLDAAKICAIHGNTE